jgi:ferritin-like metal-binding protein YciE
MPAKDKVLTERDTKLVQWLNEAHAKEAELEVDLAAHIKLTQKAAYKKRLQAHLKETKEHKRSVARRIKQIGGVAATGPAVPGVPTAVGEVAGKAVAAVKGQVGTVRALVTEQPETHLRNVQEELREEQVEIATYLRIETLAVAVGDRDTEVLARRIRRQEERMAKYLTAELPRLVKDVVKAEIPRDQRATPARSRRSTSARSAGRSSSPGRASSPANGSARSTGASGSSRSSSSSNGAGASRAHRAPAHRAPAHRAPARGGARRASRGRPPAGPSSVDRPLRGGRSPSPARRTSSRRRRRHTESGPSRSGPESC